MIGIGVDMDGVLCENDASFCDAVNLRLGTELEPVDLTSYDFLYRFVEARVPDPRTFLEELWHAPGYLKNLPFILPALAASRKIAGLVDTFHVVTARSANAPAEEARDVRVITKLWLDRYGIPYDAIVHTRDKVDYCLANHLDYLIEDAPHIAIEAAERGLRVFLCDQPYNQEVELGATGRGRGRIFRVEHIGDVPELLKQDLLHMDGPR